MLMGYVKKSMTELEIGWNMNIISVKKCIRAHSILSNYFFSMAKTNGSWLFQDHYFPLYKLFFLVVILLKRFLTCWSCDTFEVFPRLLILEIFSLLSLVFTLFLWYDFFCFFLMWKTDGLPLIISLYCSVVYRSSSNGNAFTVSVLFLHEM